LLDKVIQMITVIQTRVVLLAFNQDLLNPIDRFNRWQIHKCQSISCLEQITGIFKSGPAFFIHQCRYRIGKPTLWVTTSRIIACWMALSFKKQRPARTKTAQYIIDPRASGNQLRFSSTFKVRPAKLCRTLETAILVENNTGRDKAGPGQIISQQRRALLVFTQVQHERTPLCLTWRTNTSIKAGSLRAA